jgi:probable phosphoglycerate mutase
VNLTNIYLARHGETEYNRKNQIQGRGIDASLNNRGLQQAQAIAEYLQEVTLHRVFSSSLKRSRETAEVIARSYGLEVEAHQELDEMNFGILEGRPISDIEPQLQSLHNNWKAGKVNHASREGESPAMVLQRAGKKIETIIREQQSTNLLFVLHGRLLRILLSHWLEYGLAGMHRVPHSNGALYHLQWNGEQFNPVFLHETEHLEFLSN